MPDSPDALDQAFDRLESVSPRRIARALSWLRSPHGRYLRIPLGLLCLLAALFWFLPVVGIEYLPLGLLLLAHDIPWLRRPVGRLILRMLDVGEGWLRRWRARGRRGP